MDAFSYLSVLLSVILGLAIQQVLLGYRGLALLRRRMTWYAPPSLFLLLASIACFSRRPRLHEFLAGLMLALFVIYTTMLFARLGQ